MHLSRSRDDRRKEEELTFYYNFFFLFVLCYTAAIFSIIWFWDSRDGSCFAETTQCDYKILLACLPIGGKLVGGWEPAKPGTSDSPKRAEVTQLMSLLLISFNLRPCYKPPTNYLSFSAMCKTTNQTVEASGVATVPSTPNKPPTYLPAKEKRNNFIHSIVSSHNIIIGLKYR